MGNSTAFVNYRKTVRNHWTLTNALNDRTIRKGDCVNVRGFSAESGGAGCWDVVDRSTVIVSPNAPDFGNVIPSQVRGNLAFVLREREREDPRRWGAVFDNITDIGKVLNDMLIAGVVVSIPNLTAVVNTTVNLLEKSTLVFNGSNLKTTNDNLTMFKAVSVDNFSITGFGILRGNASGGESSQKLIGLTGCCRYVIENLALENSKGHGLHVMSDGELTTRSEHGKINNVSSYGCYTGWQFDGGTSAEYTVLTGCSAEACVVGVRNIAGNTNWTGGNIVDNSTGIELFGGSNDNHGTFTGVNINHNAVTLTGLNVANGYTFTGCHIYGSGSNGKILLTNCKQFDFNGGTLACPVQIDKGLATKNGLNIFRNMYVNVESWLYFVGDDLDNLESYGHYGDSGKLNQFNFGSHNKPKTPVLQNNWQNYGLQRGDVGYRKEDNGDISLHGTIKGGIVGQTIFTLPDEYRTSHSRHLIVDDGSLSGVGKIMINPNGNVDYISGVNTRVCLDGLRFSSVNTASV